MCPCFIALLPPTESREGERLLSVVLPSPRAHERVNGRYLTLDGQIISVFYPSFEQLLTDARRFLPTHNAYYAVALRNGRDGTKIGATRLGALYADIDAKLWADT